MKSTDSKYAKSNNSVIDKRTASEIFEYAHTLYGTQSIEETIKVLEGDEDCEEIIRKALS
jgi:hypothetical protein